MELSTAQTIVVIFLVAAFVVVTVLMAIDLCCPPSDECVTKTQLPDDFD